MYIHWQHSKLSNINLVKNKAIPYISCRWWYLTINCFCSIFILVKSPFYYFKNDKFKCAALIKMNYEHVYQKAVIEFHILKLGRKNTTHHFLHIKASWFLQHKCWDLSCLDETWNHLKNRKKTIWNTLKKNPWIQKCIHNPSFIQYFKSFNHTLHCVLTLTNSYHLKVLTKLPLWFRE